MAPLTLASGWATGTRAGWTRWESPESPTRSATPTSLMTWPVRRAKLDVERAHAGDPLAVDGRAVERGAVGQRRQDLHLGRGVEPLDVGRRVALGVAERLGLGQHARVVAPLGRHRREDVVGRPVDDPHHPLDPLAGQRRAQRPQDRDASAHRGLVEEVDAPWASARDASSVPAAAIRALLAVTTDAPRSIAASIAARATSVPPTTSTTTSTSARSARASASPVTRRGRDPVARPAGVAHRDPDELERAVDRVRELGRRFGSVDQRRATSAPTVPQPTTPTRTTGVSTTRLPPGASGPQASRLARSVEGLAPQHHARAAVGDEHDRGRGRPGCRSRPSSSRRRRSPASPPRRRPRSRRAGRPSSTSTSPLSQCLPTRRTAAREARAARATSKAS